MDHFVNIYKTKAAAYHTLIAAEDVDGNLLPALQAITPLARKRVLDLGSGTGRIPLLLLGLDCEIISLDLHHAMLVEQASQFSSLRAKRSKLPPQAEGHPLIQADIRNLPLGAGLADVVIAGWAIGHFTGWYPKDWKHEGQKAISEMNRGVRPGGAIIILETMGTASEKASPPNAALAKYYNLFWKTTTASASRL